MDDPREYEGSYQKGVEQGKVLERLEGHDDHFRRINGSIDATEAKLTEMEKALNRMIVLLTESSAMGAMSEERRATSEVSRSNTSSSWIHVLVIVGFIITTLLVLLILVELNR